MKFIFNDRNASVCETFRDVLSSVLPDLEVRHGDFEQVPKTDYDFLFTPGNSYGQMTGGFDLAVRNVWPESERDVQRAISHQRNGMLAVGDWLSVHLGPRVDPMATSAAHDPILIYTPTMRMPMPIADTENVYWAYRAAFLALEAHGRGLLFTSPKRVLVSAFGTSAGRMNPLCAAHMLRLAFQHVTRPPIDASTGQMWNDHREIRQWLGPNSQQVGPGGTWL